MTVYANGDPEQAARISGQFHIEESSKNRDQKFKMFFSGLVFATISFIGTHPVSAAPTWIKIFETLSLVFLLLSGIILLIQSAGYKVIFGKNVGAWKRSFFEIIFDRVIAFWLLFVFGMGVMVFDRSMMTFLSS